MADFREAPVYKAEKKIKDETGKARYIVDLVEDTVGKPQRFVTAAEKIEWHKARAAEQFDKVAKIRGIKLVGSTSLVGTSFVAYLDEKEVEQLKKDRQVAMLTEDRAVPLSALWNNTTESGSETRSWGLHALGIPSGSLTGGATVYVLDSGVDMHNDLPGLSNQNRLTAFDTTSNGQPLNPTGCYPHATHVAGIIGAGHNGIGVIGVVPGVQMVSVGLGTQNIGNCSDGIYEFGVFQGYAISAFTLGLDKIKQRVLQSGEVGIVNISSNAGGGVYSPTGTIGAKMANLATPSPYDGGYRGALIVQSAGNQNSNACEWAYNAQSGYDGILVIGGLDDTARPVKMLNAIPAYSAPDLASNTGGCVDLWAPSQRVKSTWAANTYKELSGTSMAAPHIAGLAAAILASDPYIQTSTDLELAVRGRLVNVIGPNVLMARWAGGPVSAAPTVEIAIGHYDPMNPELSTANRLSVTQKVIELFPHEFNAGNLRFDSDGATSCFLDIYRNGFYQGRFNFASSANIGSYGNTAQGGQFQWIVTCASAQGLQTTVSASGKAMSRV